MLCGYVYVGPKQPLRIFGSSTCCSRVACYPRLHQQRFFSAAPKIADCSSASPWLSLSRGGLNPALLWGSFGLKPWSFRILFPSWCKMIYPSLSIKYIQNLMQETSSNHWSLLHSHHVMFLHLLHPAHAVPTVFAFLPIFVPFLPITPADLSHGRVCMRGFHKMQVSNLLGSELRTLAAPSNLFA